jgi:hypothetical protein
MSLSGPGKILDRPAVGSVVCGSAAVAKSNAAGLVTSLRVRMQMPAATSAFAVGQIRVEERFLKVTAAKVRVDAIHHRTES